MSDTVATVPLTLQNTLLLQLISGGAGREQLVELGSVGRALRLEIAALVHTLGRGRDDGWSDRVGLLVDLSGDTTSNTPCGVGEVSSNGGGLRPEVLRTFSSGGSGLRVVGLGSEVGGGGSCLGSEVTGSVGCGRGSGLGLVEESGWS